MILELNLKTNNLSDDENNFNYDFSEWSYTPPNKSETWGKFQLGDLTISRKEISKVIYKKEEEILTFIGDYDGEEYISALEITNETNYIEKDLLNSLDLKLDTYLYHNPLSGGKGEVKGEIKVYFNYDDEEFEITINKLVLEEE